MTTLYVEQSVIILESLLSGNFFSLGIKLIGQFLDHSNNDPLVTCLLFPSEVMCSITYIGPSGEPVMEEDICTLAINEFNQMWISIYWLV